MLNLFKFAIHVWIPRILNLVNQIFLFAGQYCTLYSIPKISDQLYNLPLSMSIYNRGLNASNTPPYTLFYVYYLNFRKKLQFLKNLVSVWKEDPKQKLFWKQRSNILRRGPLKTEKNIKFPDGGFFKKLDDLMPLFSIFEISVLKAEDEIWPLNQSGSRGRTDHWIGGILPWAFD